MSKEQKKYKLGHSLILQINWTSFFDNCTILYFGILWLVYGHSVR